MEHPHGGHRQRLRQRYLTSGASAFADHELLELLLTYAIPRRDVNATAHALLNRFGSLEAVFSADIAALCGVEGVGESAALFLHMQRDLQQRMALRRFSGRDGRVRLNSAYDVACFVHELLYTERSETVLLLCLNTQRMLISTQRIGGGTLDRATVYPRMVAEQALLQNAHSVILVHNHPSGNPLPSPQDHATTEAVRAAVKSLDISLLDHLIVGHGAVYSSASNCVVTLSGENVQTQSPEEYSQQLQVKRPPLAAVMEQYRA